MNADDQDRLDHLIVALADGELSAEQLVEVESLLARADARALRRAQALLVVEAGLRRLRAGDVSAAVMNAIEARAAAARADVMAEIARKAPDVSWGRRGQRRKRAKWMVGLFLLGGGGALAWTLMRKPGERREDVARRAAAVQIGSPAPKPNALPPRLRIDPGGPAETPAAVDVKGRVLFSYDFEDGRTPAALGTGAVVSAPPAAGGQFAALGGVSQWAPAFNLVSLQFERDGHSLAFNPRSVVAFDVWAGDGVRRLVVQLFNETRRKNFHYITGALPAAQWMHVTVCLSDLVVVDRSDAVARTGEPLSNLTIVGGKLPGRGLYIDNVVALQLPDEAPCPTSGAAALP